MKTAQTLPADLPDSEGCQTGSRFVLDTIAAVGNMVWGAGHMHSHVANNAWSTTVLGYVGKLSMQQKLLAARPVYASGVDLRPSKTHRPCEQLL